MSKAVSEISQIASRYYSSIVIKYDNKSIDAKSMLGLFTSLLGSHVFGIEIYGPDAEEARKAMAEVFEKHGLKYELLG